MAILFLKRFPQETGSRAEYIKVINKDGDTIAYNKITYDPKGNIVHDKDKFNTK